MPTSPKQMERFDENPTESRPTTLRLDDGGNSSRSAGWRGIPAATLHSVPAVRPVPRRRGTTIVVLTLLALLVEAACGRAGTSNRVSPPRADDPRAEVAAMLRQRAEALAAGDVEGYLRPLGPEARSSEGPIAQGALTVPLASIDLTLDEAVVSL